MLLDISFKELSEILFNLHRGKTDPGDVIFNLRTNYAVKRLRPKKKI